MFFVSGNLEKVMSNKLFIIYKSKNFVSVNESLISLLEKHSISYSMYSREHTAQNTADRMYRSRQVLIVKSDNYLSSNLCRKAVQRAVDTKGLPLTVVLINKSKKKQLPCALREKNLLNLEKHTKEKDLEEKLLHAIFGGKTVST